MKLIYHHRDAPRRLMLNLLALTLLTSCAFEGGEPWGWIETELTVAELATAGDIEILSQTVHLDQLRFISTDAPETGAKPFDPADPPPGFGHCHDDHCHSDDGRVLSYDEIANRSAASARSLAVVDVHEPLELPALIDKRTKILDVASISTVELLIDELYLEASLPEDFGEAGTSYTLQARVSLGAQALSVPVMIEIGRHQPAEHHLALSLAMPADLLLDLDLSQATLNLARSTLPISATVNESLHDELLHRIVDHSRFTATVD